MKSFSESFLSRSIPLFLTGVLSVFAVQTARSTITLEPLWALSPDLGEVWPSPNNNERGIAYNPVSGNVLVVTRSSADIFLLNKDTGAMLMEPEIGGDGLPTGQQVPRKLLKGDFFLPPDSPPAPTVVSSGTSGALNLVGVADDGAIYSCNLVVGSQVNNLRIYRWESDGVNSVETNFAPYVAWTGNPDLSGITSQRWGDSFTVRGAGVNTQILMGSDAGALAVFTTANGVDFVPAFITGALSGPGRGLGFSEGNTFYNKSLNGTDLRRSSFSLSGPQPTVTVLNTFTVPSTTTNPLAVDLVKKRLAMIDLTGSGADIDILRLYDITTPTSAPSALATANLQFPNANLNVVGSLAMGDDKVFVSSTNKGIQTFKIVDDNAVLPPEVTVTPAASSVWIRGLITLTGAATGVPPITYQWYKDTVLLDGKTDSALLINPVTAGDSGSYVLRATNAAGFTDSAPAVVTAVAGTDTEVLTKVWQVAAGSQPWMTTGNTERGMDANPVSGNVYVVSRAGANTVRVLSGADGTLLRSLNTTGITGGLAGITLNMIGVAADGVIYAANLGDDSNPYKIYRWDNDNEATEPVEVYFGNPIAGRLGDTMDVRGSGTTTEIVVGSRNNDGFVIFRLENGFLTPQEFANTGAAPGSYGLSVAFGNGNAIWAKSSGIQFPLVRAVYDGTTGVAVATSAAGPLIDNNAGLAYDPVNQLIATSGRELSDSIRLYRVTDSATGALELLDQEFYPTDNGNANGTGSAAFAGGRLYTLNTNNGLVAATVTLAGPAAPPEITNVIRIGPLTTFTLTGESGATYLIQRSLNLSDWTDDGTVTLSNGISTSVARTSTEPREFYRARKQ